MSKRHPTFTKRIVASLVDAILMSPLAFWLNWEAASGAKAINLVLIGLVSILLFTLLAIGFRRVYGQTLGEMLVGIQVMDLTGGRLYLQQAVFRVAAMIALNVLALSMMAFSLFHGETLLHVSSDGSIQGTVIPYYSAGMVGFLLEFLSMATNRQRRSLQDYMAGSIVRSCRLSYARSGEHFFR